MKYPILFILLFGFFSTVSQSVSQFELRDRKTHFFPATELGSESLNSPEDYYFRALAYFLIGDFNQSDHWLDSLGLHGPMSYPLKGRYYLLKGRVSRLLDDHLEAATMFDSALVACKKEGNTEDVFRVYVDLFEHCRASVMFEEAEVYKRQLNRLSNDTTVRPEIQARFMHRKAAYWIETKDSLNYAEQLLEGCIQHCQLHNLPWHEATARLDYGYILFNSGREGALQQFEKAEEIWSRLGYRRDLAQVRFNISKAYTEHGRFSEALEKLEIIEADALSYGWTLMAASVWEVRSEIYSKQGRNDEALSAYHTYHKILTEHLAQRIDEQIAEMMAKIGAESARNDLLLAQNENLLTQERLEIESNQKSIFLIISFALLVIVTILYIFYQRSKTANIQLTDQRNLIKSANEKLELTLGQKDALYRELHHRIKNNLTTLSGLLYLQSRGLRSEEGKKALTETRGRIQSMSLIHQGLYQQDKIVQVKFASYIDELMPNLLSLYGEVSRKVNWSIDCEAFELPIETAMSLGMVLNELVTNAFKYAFNDREKGELKIIGRVLGKEGWIISVQDDGPGMPNDFDWKNPTSLGLKLIKVFVDEMGADFSYGYFDGIADFSITYQPKHD